MISRSSLKERGAAQFESGRQTQALIAEEGRSMLSSLAPVQKYPPSIELFKQGCPAQDVYLVEHGLVKLMRLCDEGRSLILGLRPSGWVLGASSVILQKPYPASAITVTNCHLRRFLATTFLELLKTSSQFSLYFNYLQSREVYDQIGHQVSLGFLSARHRLEQLLWQLIHTHKLNDPQQREFPKEMRLNLPLKHSEIADLIAVTPEHLSRVMKQMQQEGLLRREKGWIIISDPKKLQPIPDLYY